MHIKSDKGVELLKVPYTLTDDINGVPTLETEVMQLNESHDTPISMHSQAFPDNYVTVIKDSEAVADSSLLSLIGVHQFVYDMNLSRIYDEYTQYFAIESILSLIFADTEYTFEVKGDKTYYALMFQNFGDNDKMSLIKQVCSRWDAEYHIHDKHVVFGDRRGAVTNKLFRYKMNITDTNVNLDISEGATYIVGRFGKVDEDNPDNSTYVEKDMLHPLAEKYGIRHAKPYSNENITQETTMQEYLKRKIEETWKLSIELDVMDLQGTGEVNVGDTVLAIDERMDIQIKTRIIKLVRHYDINDKVIRTVVTLGSYSFIDSVSNADTETADLENVVVDRVNEMLERERAAWDDKFNRERDKIVDSINDEFDRQKQLVEDDWDAWKLQETEIRNNIRESVDRVVGDMDNMETVITDWQNTASTRFGNIETRLSNKLEFDDLSEMESRLTATEQGIDALFLSSSINNLALGTTDTKNVRGQVDTPIYRLSKPVDNQEVILSFKAKRETGAGLQILTIEFRDENENLIHSRPGILINSEGEMSLSYIIGSHDTPIHSIRFRSGSAQRYVTLSAVMLEVRKIGQSDPSPWQAAEAENLFGMLEVNAENMDIAFGRIGDNEKDIANFQMTAEGLQTTVGQLEDDFVTAASDWQQTKDGFDSYVISNNQTVNGLQSDVSNVSQRADGLQQTVSRMRGDVNDLENWKAVEGSRFEQAADGFELRSWREDIETGGDNLLTSTDFSDLTQINDWRNLSGSRSRSWPKFVLIQNPDNRNFFGTVSKNEVQIEAGRTYALSFLGAHDVGVDSIDRVFLLDGNDSNVQTLNQHRKYKRLENPHVTGHFNYGLYYFIFTAEYTGTVSVVISANNNSNPTSNGWIRISEPKIEIGNTPSPWQKSSAEFLQHTDFILRSDGFLLGGNYVGGNHYSTAIVGDAAGLKLIGDRIDIDGNVTVLGRIRAEAINAVYANISEVRTRILTANVIKSNMLDVNQAMVQQFYSHTAFINNASIRAANIRDLSAITIAATQISGGILRDQSDNFNWNLNTGHFETGNATFIFKNARSAMIYQNGGRATGLHFALDTSNRPVGVFGAGNNSGTTALPAIDSNAADFVGMRAFSFNRQLELHGNTYRFRRSVGGTAGKALYLDMGTASNSVITLEADNNSEFTIGGAGSRKVKKLSTLALNNAEIVDYVNNGIGIMSPNGRYGIIIQDNQIMFRDNGTNYTFR